MIWSGTSFGCHQVVDSVYLIEVRPFNPYRMLGLVHSSVDNYLCLAYGAVGGGIEFPYPDGAVSVVLRFPFRCIIVYNVTFPVFIEENGRVDASDFRKWNRVTPFSFQGVFRFDKEISDTVNTSSDEIKRVVVRILFNVRCVNASRQTGLVEPQLRWPV